ncbi:MAG: anhydro-N-acetylmuramic acid kinase [Gammaproteobacteria bacterium]|nr:anhydro-N-acetylmuramic acid kinase [Gammaproteobacteria bacterium]
MGLYLGLISGTSMDAIDAALVDFDSRPMRVVAARAAPYEPRLASRLAALLDAPDAAPLDEIGRIDVQIGAAFAEAALVLLHEAGVPAREVVAIGSHGQTLRHRIEPPAPFTWQIGDPNVIAERTGLTVVADFRRRDVAAGGQGAPLVPPFHDRLFRDERQDRVILNVGGIANVTVLRRGATLLGFDTGPGNRLMDAWIARHRGESFDRDGAFAASGRCDEALLAHLLEEPYFELPAPKSTGRELFNAGWLDARLASAPAAPGGERTAADVQASLRELTAESVARAVRQTAPGASIYVCGGGAHNQGLLQAIARRAAPSRVLTTAALGLDPDFVEAAAFAFFARCTLAGVASGDPAVTGARGARVLGAIYPSGP